MTFAERLRGIISQLTLLHNGQQVKLTCSFGVSQVDPRDIVNALLVQLADQALFDAKRSGRNRVVAAKLQEREASPAGLYSGGG
jgi:diguanylate cyclase